MVTSKIFKIKGMHCVSCAMNIDGELEDALGVLESSTNYAKHLTKVKFDNDKISPEKIAEIIKSTGYAVEN